MNIRELAELAGLSKSTVAYALKNSPLVNKTTRERVQALAKTHGYTPSPVVNQFMHQIRTSQVRKRSSNLAYILHGHEARLGERQLHEQELIEGASEQAKRLGYAMEIIPWEAEALTEMRLNSVIKARGIQGILIGPASQTQAMLKLDWARVYALASGYTLKDPPLDRIASDLFLSIITSIEQALSRNYRKIILAISESSDARVGYRWRSAALIQKELHGTKRVQLLTDNWDCPKPSILDKLAASKGCAIIGSQQVYSHLQKIGLSIPTDIGFIALDTCGIPKTISAIYQPHKEMGAQAVNQIASMVERGQFGLPNLPIHITKECGWHEGETLPIR
ncbi:LacI family DNA-binding transcriptional regulator [Coraliomargarita parva]|uniref:LacI family DNA-binding transcriptional regulator n=1 Tax=Coraliomargarita parva TaxID=3014050 RepID=UPI0022B5444F|nr:LacI family DNA-binding transcriptional regulator [Coraliomargarita parva]